MVHSMLAFKVYILLAKASHLAIPNLSRILSCEHKCKRTRNVWRNIAKDNHKEILVAYAKTWGADRLEQEHRCRDPR